MLIEAKVPMLSYKDVCFDSKSIGYYQGNICAEFYDIKEGRSLGNIPLISCTMDPKQCMIPVKYIGDVTIFEELKDPCYMDISTVSYHVGEIFVEIYKDKERTKPMAKMRMKDFEELIEEQKELEEDLASYEEQCCYEIAGYKFVQTSSHDPEFYCVYTSDDEQIASVRVWGNVICMIPDADGEMIYNEMLVNNSLGFFSSEFERMIHLHNIRRALDCVHVTKCYDVDGYKFVRTSKPWQAEMYDVYDSARNKVAKINIYGDILCEDKTGRPIYYYIFGDSDKKSLNGYERQEHFKRIVDKINKRKQEEKEMEMREKKEKYYVVDEYRFVQTCMACPEQYDVYIDGSDEMVAYVRLRWGILTCTVPDAGGREVYQHKFEKQIGNFNNDEERETFFIEIADRLRNLYLLEYVGTEESADEEEETLDGKEDSNTLEFMSAAEAYEKSKTRECEIADKELKFIFKSIKNVIGMGGYILELDNGISAMAQKTLIDLGYKVTNNAFSCTTISWCVE